MKRINISTCAYYRLAVRDDWSRDPRCAENNFKCNIAVAASPASVTDPSLFLGPRSVPYSLGIAASKTPLPARQRTDGSS